MEADFLHITGQYELVLESMLNPGIEGEKCTGALAFCTVDCHQCYWQFSLEEEVRDYFTFVTRNGVFTPTQVPQAGKILHHISTQ